MHVGFPQFIKWKCGNRMCAAFFSCILTEEHVVNDQCQFRNANGKHKLFVERHKSSIFLREEADH